MTFSVLGLLALCQSTGEERPSKGGVHLLDGPKCFVARRILLLDLGTCRHGKQGFQASGPKMGTNSSRGWSQSRRRRQKIVQCADTPKCFSYFPAFPDRGNFGTGSFLFLYSGRRPETHFYQVGKLLILDGPIRFIAPRSWCCRSVGTLCISSVLPVEASTCETACYKKTPFRHLPF